MNEMAKMLIVAGGMLILAGAVLFFIGKFPGIAKLPGDILVKKENFTFYFPVTTSIVVSVILSIIFFLWSKR